jgi:hypothetical protein
MSVCRQYADVFDLRDGCAEWSDVTGVAVGRVGRVNMARR